MKKTKYVIAISSVVASLFLCNSVLADVTKEEGSTELTVTNPEVTVNKSDDTIWANVDVNIKTDIPDEVQINQGDTMTFNMPEELTFGTNHNFPVYNNSGDSEVGQAEVNASENKVTTTFNNYFTEHPLDKSISLNLHTKINRKVVEANTKHDISFNGTVVELDAGSKGVENTNEELYKYGFQDKNDPSVVHWTARINYKKSYMENVNISDTWSDDQDYVEGSLNYYYINSVDPWKYDAPATEALTNTKFHKNGFSTTVNQINKKILMIEYKTKLKQMVYNPTNKIDVYWDGGKTSHEAETKLVNGDGRADGKTRPKGEVPNDAPVLDKPEWNGGVVPLDPPVNEKPEWQGGVVPNDPPVYDKPEWNGGTVPLDPPVHDKPEYNGGAVPLDPPVYEKPSIDIKDITKMPPAPVEDKPELNIPVVPTPKYEEPKVNIKDEDSKQETVKESSESKYIHKGSKMLPVTGEKSETTIIVIGFYILGFVSGYVVKLVSSIISKS